MKVRPLGNRVVLKVQEEVEKVVGGIILPETAKEIPYEGEIIAVGPGLFENGTLLPMNVKVGDKVIYKDFAGTEVKLDEEGKYLILREDDILAIIQEEDN